MKQLFGGLIAVLLLGLYVYTVYEAIVVARCLGMPDCREYTSDTFTLGYAHAMSLVGGSRVGSSYRCACR